MTDSSQEFPVGVAPIEQESLKEPAIALMADILSYADLSEIRSEVALGYVYERKGYDNFDSIEGKRNQTYGTMDDDLLIQVTLIVRQGALSNEGRVSFTRMKEEVRRSWVEKSQAAIAEKEAQRAALDAEIATLHEKHRNLFG